MDALDRMLKLSDAVAQRYDQRATEREMTHRQIEAGNILAADDPQRVEQRLRRLDITLDSTALESGVSKGVIGDHDSLIALERILGENDLIDVSFLWRGALAADAVCRVHIRERGQAAGFGTGFLVSPRLLLTNNHVLPTRSVAATSQVEFHYETDGRGNLRPSVFFNLAPVDCFLTDKQLDFTLVAVEAQNGDARKPEEFGWLPLIADEGKVIKGERLNIVQHPSGDLKQIALRENTLEDVLDNFLHYKTDTAPGSSGSPVFNDQWEVVALHHAGVPMKDQAGNLLTWDGQPWLRPMGLHKLGWLANEGVRISRIIAYVKAQTPRSAAMKALLDEMCHIGETVPPAAGPPGGVDRDALLGSGALPGSGADRRTRGKPIPVVGPHRGGGSESPMPAVDLDDIENSNLQSALAELRAAAERDYYNAVQDARDCGTYYAPLFGEFETRNTISFQIEALDGRIITFSIDEPMRPAADSGVPTFEALSALVQQTHLVVLPYKPLRLVYPWIDLHPDGMLRSIYSGKVYDPKLFIEADVRIEAAREAQLTALTARESNLSAEALAFNRVLLEAQLPFNCEHAVPQSWFNRTQPARGDLHHLFACEADCNSFRGNTPYYQFNEAEEATRSDCGRRVGNRFEPEAGKGVVARAVLYFLLRYPGEIEDVDHEFLRDRLPLLLRWHRENAVSDYERHRNSAIFALQGNRNPFIDHPEWAASIDFNAGLG